MRVTVSVDILSIYTRGMASRHTLHSVRHKLARRDGGWVCHWCKEELRCHICEPASHLPAATLEHITRLADGGARWALDNLTLACAPCNNHRHEVPRRRKHGPPRPSPAPFPLVWDDRLHTFVVDRTGARPGRITVYDSAYGRIGYMTEDGPVWEPLNARRLPTGG